MKLALLSALLLGAHAASYSDQGDSQQSAEAHESLPTQPGVAPTTTRTSFASAASVAPGAAQVGNVTELLLRRVATVDSRVLAYGGGDPASIFDAAKSLVLLVQDLTRVINGTKASLPAAEASSSTAGGSASPITRASFSASAGAGSGGPGPAMRQAVEQLLRDINQTKWAFQQASICDIMYFVVGKIGESFHDLLAAIVDEVPAADQSAANKTVSGADQTFEQSQALLGPRYCINANGHSGPDRPSNSSAPLRNPQLPPPPPPPSSSSYRVLAGSNSTMTTSSSTSSAAADATAQPTQLDATPNSSAAEPTSTAQATNDRAQGAAAETAVSGDATVGAAGSLRVPAAAAWGVLLAVPGLLL